MSKTIHMTLDTTSINAAIKELKDYQRTLELKAGMIAERLAERGVPIASARFDSTPYMGNNKDVSVTVESREGNTSYAIVASGEVVLILEFGAGVIGYGHPEPGPYGPGTYPGQTHALDPRGWWIPKDHGGGHTYGNPPGMAMYLTAKELAGMVEEVAREVFSS